MSRRVEQPEITPAGESPRSLACMPGHEAAPPPSRAPFFPLWTFQGASLSGPLPDPVTGLGMSVAASTRPSANRCLLLIDDEPAPRRLVTAIGARAGWWVMGAPDVEAAQALLQSEEGKDGEAILIDHWLPGEAGDVVIQQIRALRPDLPLLVLTAQTSVRSEEHTSELQSLMRISYAVFCLKKK